MNEKSPRKWIRLDMTAVSHYLPALEGILLINRISSWVHEDRPDGSRLTIYLPESASLAELTDSMKDAVTSGLVKIETSEIQDQDWENSWQQYYSVVRIGRNFVIKPPWLSHEERADDVVLEIEPRMAFGSGYHPTTAGTLSLMEKYIEPGQRVLDMGCGSGILGIAAARLGAGSITMADYDAICTRESHENYSAAKARHQAMTDLVEFIHTDGFSRITGPYDLTAVNVHAGFILQNMDEIYRVTAPGGYFVTGSINEGREAEIARSAEKSGFNLLETGSAEGWTGFAFQRTKAL